MTIKTGVYLGEKIADIVRATCNDRCNEIIAKSKDEETATETLFGEVYDRIELFIQSEEFNLAYAAEKPAKLEQVARMHQGIAFSKVRKIVAVAWERATEKLNQDKTKKDAALIKNAYKPRDNCTIQ
jgi:hypothetical protein